MDKLTKAFQEAKAVIFSEIKGLNVADTSKLRKELRKEGVKHTVAKLSLVKLALRRAGIKLDNLDFKTQVAVTFSPEETAGARILKKFSKANKNLKILSGILEKEPIDAQKVSQLASMPTKQELLGQLASVIGGPNRGLVTVLSGNLRGLIQVLSQIKRSDK